MNLQHILSTIGQQDPEVFYRLSPRRKVIRTIGRVTALTALPFALGSLFKKAYGKPTDAITDTLQFALRLEYLEEEFYNTALSSPGLLIPPADQAVVQTLKKDESGHVQFLKDTLTAMGEIPGPKPTFDFTGGNGTASGPFSTVFTNYETFLAVAQTFENIGVRAYKGAAGSLMSNNEVLEAALRIHSVEARHAARIQMMRKDAGYADIKPWITYNRSGFPSGVVQGAYDGEETVFQSGINIIDINGYEIGPTAATEAFDEPLTAASVAGLVDPFIV